MSFDDLTSGATSTSTVASGDTALGGAGGAVSTSGSGTGGTGGSSTTTSTGGMPHGGSGGHGGFGGFGPGGAGGTGGTVSTSGGGGTGGTASTSTSTSTSSIGPSCLGLGAGQLDCGPNKDESCCTSLPMPQGTVQLDASHSATVSDFRLDKYEITVGRFRAFVQGWQNGWRPTAGAGKHVHLNGGEGLSDGKGGYESGWNPTWDESLASNKLLWDQNLACDVQAATWSNEAGSNENRPINCATWLEVYAFCIWDEGFLPSESEWQYAAAGGGDERPYPWGAAAPTDALAVFCGASCDSTQDVGSKPAGNGKWGHMDLAGNVWEWVLDWRETPYPELESTNYANATPLASRVLRGGSFAYDATNLAASYRGYFDPTKRSGTIGARCARIP